MSLDFDLVSFVDVGRSEPERVQWFTRNITHNLAHMAQEAGIYELLWRPDENGYRFAEDIAPNLALGIRLLEAEPDRFRKFSPANGWGSYAGLIEFAKEVLRACERYPKAEIEVSR